MNKIKKYRLVYKIGDGPPGYYDSEYEYSSYYSSEKEACDKGNIELEKNGRLYERHYERYRRSFVEIKEFSISETNNDIILSSNKISNKNKKYSSSIDKICNYINENPPIKLQGCMTIKNPKETDFSDYIDIKNLQGYMVNFKKKTIINKISKRIQKNVININKSKRYNRPCNFSITYEDLIKKYC